MSSFPVISMPQRKYPKVRDTEYGARTGDHDLERYAEHRETLSTNSDYLPYLLPSR